VAFTLSSKAEDDLIEIYIEGASLFGEHQADLYHRKIGAMIDLLSENPRIARERLEISPSVRIHPFHSHLIVYIVDDNNDVFIIRICHGHEDWQSNSL